MSKRGRRPKPSRQKELEGNPGKRPINKREPKPQSKVKRPRGLKGLPRKFWDEHAEELERIGILTGVDSAAFRLMAQAYAFAIEAAEELNEVGFTFQGRDGPRKHPLHQIFRDNATLFKSFATEFGMTPSSRTSLKVPKDDEQLTLADMLFGAANDMIDQASDDEVTD